MLRFADFLLPEWASDWIANLFSFIRDAIEQLLVGAALKPKYPRKIRSIKSEHLVLESRVLYHGSIQCLGSLE